MTDNINAFLAMISHAEGTDRVSDPYRVCFGFKHTISDLSDHPAITGEWRGEPLDFLGPRYVGMVSTAAGKYQLIKSTWIVCKATLQLPDFGPSSQDQAAILLIKGNHAYDALLAGNFSDAVSLCNKTWASLPGSTSGQPQKDLATLSQVYSLAGGRLA